jgi:hypothetical protein
MSKQCPNTNGTERRLKSAKFEACYCDNGRKLVRVTRNLQCVCVKYCDIKNTTCHPSFSEKFTLMHWAKWVQESQKLRTCWKYCKRHHKWPGGRAKDVKQWRLKSWNLNTRHTFTRFNSSVIVEIRKMWKQMVWAST